VNVTGEGIVSYSDGSPPCSTSNCTTNERQNQVVFLTATPAQGYTFQGWTHGCLGPGAICGITPAQASGVVSAEFVHAGGFQLTVSGPGVVVGDYGGIQCGMSQSVCSDNLSGTGTTIFTPTPAPGAVFLGWGGACAQFATEPCAVDNGSLSGATAAFALAAPASGPQQLTVTHSVPVASAPDLLDFCLAVNPCVTPVPSGSYYSLTAGSSFVTTPLTRPVSVSWQGGCVGSWPVCALRVDSPTQISLSGNPAASAPLPFPAAPAAVTVTVRVTGRGNLRALRGTLSRGCGSRPPGVTSWCTMTEAGGGFALRASAIGRNKFRGWGSTPYTFCKPKNRPSCSASVGLEQTSLTAVFSGG
jgi:hypothetical protein